MLKSPMKQNCTPFFKMQMTRNQPRAFQNRIFSRIEQRYIGWTATNFNTRAVAYLRKMAPMAKFNVRPF